MAAGTKVTLALVVLLLVALVLYYNSLTPDKAIAVSEQPPAVQPQPVQQQQANESRLSPDGRQQREPLRREREDALRQAPASTGRLLGESIEQALAEPGDTQSQPDAQLPSIGDREPVVVTDQPVETGGKDAPPPMVLPDDTSEAPESKDQPQPDEPQAADEAQPESEPEPEPEPQPEPQPQPQPQLPPPPAYTQYTVKSGDTMSSIAREWFGTDAKWDLIARANPLVDPNRLNVGDVLRLPPKDAQRDEAVAPSRTSRTEYVVRSGDNLSKIARQYYGDESKWRIIHDANRELLGDSPENLRVGMRLVIPPAPQPAE